MCLYGVQDICSQLSERTIVLFIGHFIALCIMNSSHFFLTESHPIYIYWFIQYTYWIHTIYILSQFILQNCQYTEVKEDLVLCNLDRIKPYKICLCLCHLNNVRLELDTVKFKCLWSFIHSLIFHSLTLPVPSCICFSLSGPSFHHFQSNGLTWSGGWCELFGTHQQVFAGVYIHCSKIIRFVV